MTVVYTAAIFLSALLLFLIQPMVTKHLVPVLGGAPAVWNTAMCFFQAVLLLGYLFAHVTHRFLSPRTQSLAQFGLLGFSLLWLPVSIAAVETDVVANPGSWLLATLLLSVGLPFLALSSNSPTLQAWFANTGHEDSHNPYFLYSASNLGSMVALLAYPVVVEPYLGLGEQRTLWSVLYVVLVVLLAACAVILWRARPPSTPATASVSSSSETLTVGRRAMWELLAFVPSSLLLGTTTYITTDLASVPLLWTVPLALYLLSSVLVFAKKPILYPDINGALIPLTVALAITLLFDWFRTGTAFILLPMGVLFVASMVCHGRLAEDRPSAAHLTEFYFWLSVGGVCGGIFNALLAPVLFDSIWEYPLALVLAIMLRPSTGEEDASSRARWLDVGLPAAVGLGMALFSLSLRWWSRDYLALLSTLGEAVTAVIPSLGDLGISSLGFLSMAFYAVPAVACFFFRTRPARFALMLGGIFYIGMAQPFQTETRLLYKERNFFGSIKVTESRSTGLRHMYHGTTLHGLQPVSGERRLSVTSFYTPLRPLWSVLPERFHRGEIAAVGLGAGTVACIAGPEQHVTFYEINPAVEEMARNTDFFTYLSDCPPEIDVVLGDARLSLLDARDGLFELLIMDAFSSDSVPIHLLTQEAVDLYLRKLSPGGVLAFHISSWHLDFIPVLSAVAEARGLHGIWLMDLEGGDDPLKRRSKWAILSADATPIAKLREAEPRWEAMPPASPEMLWTDDFSNIFSILQ